MDDPDFLALDVFNCAGPGAVVCVGDGLEACPVSNSSFLHRYTASLVNRHILLWPKEEE